MRTSPAPRKSSGPSWPPLTIYRAVVPATCWWCPYTISTDDNAIRTCLTDAANGDESAREMKWITTLMTREFLVGGSEFQTVNCSCKLKTYRSENCLFMFVALSLYGVSFPTFVCVRLRLQNISSFRKFPAVIPQPRQRAQTPVREKSTSFPSTGGRAPMHSSYVRAWWRQPELKRSR